MAAATRIVKDYVLNVKSDKGKVQDFTFTRQSDCVKAIALWKWLNEVNADKDRIADVKITVTDRPAGKKAAGINDILAGLAKGK